MGRACSPFRVCTLLVDGLPVRFIAFDKQSSGHLIIGLGLGLGRDQRDRSHRRTGSAGPAEQVEDAQCVGHALEGTQQLAIKRAMNRDRRERVDNSCVGLCC